MTSRQTLTVLAPLAVIALVLATNFLPAGPAETAPKAAVEPAPTSPAKVAETALPEAPAAAPNDAPSLAVLAATTFDGRDLTFGTVQATTATYVRHYITYKSGDLTISGTFAIPKGAGPFPLVIQNHGYIDPKIYTNGRGLRREQDYMASRGLAVLHTDYRGHAESTKDGDSELRIRLGYAEDSINAVYAVRAAIAAGDKKLATVNADHVGMIGHSMGGGVTMQTITAVPGLLDAAVLYAPVSGDARDNFNKWTRSRPETAAEIVKRYGDPDSAPAFWNGVSPIKHLGVVQTPVMLHHGTNDESCPHDWAVALDAAWKSAGKNMTFHSYPGQPHEFTTAWPLMMQRTVAFFKEHLQ